MLLFFDYQLNVSTYNDHLVIRFICSFYQQSKVHFKMTSMVPILIQPPLIDSNLIINSELTFHQTKSLTHTTQSVNMIKHMEALSDQFSIDRILQDYSTLYCK